MSIWNFVCASLIGGGAFFAVITTLFILRSPWRSSALLLVCGLACYAGWACHPKQPVSELPWAGYLYSQLGDALPHCPEVAASAHAIFDGDARFRESVAVLSACREESLRIRALNNGRAASSTDLRDSRAAQRDTYTL